MIQYEVYTFYMILPIQIPPSILLFLFSSLLLLFSLFLQLSFPATAVSQHLQAPLILRIASRSNRFLAKLCLTLPIYQHTLPSAYMQLFHVAYGSRVSS